MKHFFYFLFSLFLFGNLGFVFGQQNSFYTFTLKIDREVSKFNVSGDCPNELRIGLNYDGDEGNLQANDFYILWRGYNFNNLIKNEFSVNKILKEIVINSRNERYSGGFNPGCRNVHRGTRLTFINDYGKHEILVDNFSSGYWIWGWYSIFPNLNIYGNNKNFEVSEGDFTEIYSNSGYRTIEYNWQLLKRNPDNSVEWIDIPKFAGQSTISANLYDFFDESEFSNIYGKTFSIRQSAYDNQTLSDVVNFTALKSAPKIISHSKENPSCLDDTNGSVTITLDRILNQSIEESLAFSLIDKDTGNPIANYDLPNNTKEFTFGNLAPGNYLIQLNGSMLNPTDSNLPPISTYTSSTQHSLEFSVEKPQPVNFTTSKIKEVSCHGGSDGAIQISATAEPGRSFEYKIYTGSPADASWQAFDDLNSSEQTINGLTFAEYKIQVRDSKGCEAREIIDIINAKGNPDQGLGNLIIQNIDINQPVAPLEAEFTDSKQPTAFGFADGEIEVTLSGGTPNYSYTLKNSAGVVQTSSITDNQGADGTVLLFTGLRSDTYTLAVTDANYSAATQKDNCIVEGQEFFLSEPQPLEVTLTLEKVLSCNADNEYGDETDLNPFDGQRDESQDAKILASATGGVPLGVLENNGLPYFYTWKKQNPDGSWQTLTNQTNSIAVNLSAGNYALNIKDKNGVVLGTFAAGVLVEEKDSTLVVNSPPQLKINLTKTDPVCTSSTSGSISSLVSGGVGPYNYQWSNGASTKDLDNLIGGNYFVQVKDAMGCQVKGRVELENPEDIIISTLFLQNPTCFGSNNGRIEAEAIGGSGGFSYQWQDGSKNPTKTNLGAGNYTLTVTDSEGCQASKTWELTQPEALVIDLGPDRKLCKNQSLNLDAAFTNYDDPLSQYLWNGPNAFSSNESSIDIQGGEGGTYRVTGMDSRGCQATDEVIIINSDAEVDAEFLVTSQAFVGEEIVLVETSFPRPEKIEWIVPEGVDVLKDEDGYLHVIVKKEGNHSFGLKTFVDDCYEYYYKNVQVEVHNIAQEPLENEDFLKDFSISPNPTDGVFNLNAEFAEATTAHFRLVSVNGYYLIKDHLLKGKDKYEEQFSIKATTGVYVAILETKKGVFVKRIIIL